MRVFVFVYTPQRMQRNEDDGSLARRELGLLGISKRQDEETVVGLTDDRDRESHRQIYAVIATTFDSSFFPTAAASASFTAFSASFFLSSASRTLRSRSFTPALDGVVVAVAVAVVVGWLNVTLRCGLGPAAPGPPRIDPASGVGTFTSGELVDRPRWNDEGRTRPGGCWNGHDARVQPAPNRHCCT
jgi:hypothetical protein